MIDVAADIVNLAAVPFCDGIGVEKLKILMSAVNKADVIFLFCEFIKNFLLFKVAVPDKAEIAADNKRIVFF